MFLSLALVVIGVYCVAYVLIAARAMYPRWRRALLGLGGLLFIASGFEMRPPLPLGYTPPDLEDCGDARHNNC